MQSNMLQVLHCILPDGRRDWLFSEVPLHVWYDKPYNPDTLPQPSQSINAINNGSDVFWVAGNVAGARSAKLLLDFLAHQDASLPPL